MASIIFDENETLDNANKLYFSGKITEALQLATELIERDALLEKSYRLQSACYFKLQQYDESKKALHELLKINNKVADDYFNLAHIYVLQGQLDLAEKEYEKGIAITPKNINALLALSEIYTKKNEKDKAIALLQQVLTRSPEHAEAQYKLAIIQNNQEAIVASLKKVAKQKPLDADVKLLLANRYLNNADFNKAVYYINQAIAINPNFYSAIFLAGLHSHYVKKWNEATNHYCNALRLALDNPNLQLELAKNYLIQGKYDLGWQAFEWRRKLPQPSYINSLLNDYIYWRGQSLKNKHLLIYSEPNNGPTFLFLRYLADIKQKDVKITLLVTPEEIATIKNFSPVDHVISEHENISGKFDYVVSLLSIPDIKHLESGNASLRKEFQLPPLLASTTYKKIGLSWYQEKNTLFAKINEFDLDVLADIVKSINAEYVCLHPEKLNATELEWCKKNNIIVPNNIDNQISVINALDLVITADNQIAHVAASIDKPTWVMTSFVSNWYLGSQEQKTIWYPAMRLFRQRKINDWLFVIRNIISSLYSHAALTGYKLEQSESIQVKQAKALYDKGQFLDCLNFCRDCIQQYPKQAAFSFFAGIAATGLNNHELAISSLLNAERLDNNNADICTNLGTSYYRLNITDKALYYFDRAVALKPNDPECLKNLAITCFELGFPEKSIALYKKALSLKDSIENHFGYSLQLLGAGHYEEGWREYEYRLKMSQHNYNSLKINTPLWDGSNLNGKTIFIASEQGLGDNIQFFRFLFLLKQNYDCTIIFGCSSNLLRLVKQYSDLDHVICENDLIPKHDYHLPIISLAMHFKIYHESQFMADKPYIIPHPILANYWKQILINTKMIKVGFCWSGSPQHINNLRRNCNLFDFIKLMQNKNIKLYSLQKDINEDEKELLKAANIDDFGALFDDLADTTAAISQLDLVISIDSAIAHLAGAMGKKTWLLLPYYTEWRHPRNREFSPWYSSIKFYQQSIPGDWRSVFQQVESDLVKLVGKT
jgi:tetratricopeptide (TPR) repeat protein